MKVLICCYSRTGRTERAAEAVAEALRPAHEVVVERLVDTKSRRGVLGWLGAARDAWRKRKTALEPVRNDPAAFDLLVLGTPVWAGTVTPAVRTYCEEKARAAARVAFLCTMGGSGDKGTFKALTELCGKTPVATLALKDAHVRKDDPEEFRAKVQEFAATLTGGGQGS